MWIHLAISFSQYKLNLYIISNRKQACYLNKHCGWKSLRSVTQQCGFALIPGSGNAQCLEQCECVCSLRVLAVKYTDKMWFSGLHLMGACSLTCLRETRRKTSTLIGHQRHRQQRGEPTVWLLVSECMRVFVGRLHSFLKETLTAYG